MAMSAWRSTPPAHGTNGTVEEAHRLWKMPDRPNVFIKVSATTEGLPAIQALTSEGINVNVTLLFGLPRYQQVADAYLAGLAARVAHGKPVEHVVSVASFFVSRIDGLVDPLPAKVVAQGGEKAALAETVRGHVASTSTKSQDESDVKYVEALIRPDTVNTAPLETLDAYRASGDPKARLEHDVEEARLVLERLPELGINSDHVTRQLEDDGVVKFNKPFDKRLQTLASPSPRR